MALLAGAGIVLGGLIIVWLLVVAVVLHAYFDQAFTAAPFRTRPPATALCMTEKVGNVDRPVCCAKQHRLRLRDLWCAVLHIGRRLCLATIGT